MGLDRNKTKLLTPLNMLVPMKPVGSPGPVFGRYKTPTLPQLLYFIAFNVILLFFTYSFLYLLSAVKHFGTPKWIVVKGCINKLHLHLQLQ